VIAFPVGLLPPYFLVSLLSTCFIALFLHGLGQLAVSRNTDGGVVSRLIVYSL
jgi:hypothetical protein